MIGHVYVQFDADLLQLFEKMQRALSEMCVHLISTEFNCQQWKEALMSSLSPVKGPKLHVSMINSWEEKKRTCKRGGKKQRTWLGSNQQPFG